MLNKNEIALNKFSKLAIIVRYQLTFTTKTTSCKGGLTEQLLRSEKGFRCQ